MRLLLQSTAANVMVFMTDSSDHITGKTGLTLTITASKDGAAFGSISPTVTERGSGWYNVALTTSHTDTLGDMAFHVTGTSADPTDFVCRVIAVNLADSVRAGLTAMPNVSSGSAGAIITSGTGTAQLSTSSGLVTLAGVTHTGAVIPTVTTVTNQLTAAQIATGVWQDATAGDFTVTSSIGKSLYTSGVVPGGSGGLFIAGTNAATSVTTAFTTTFTGNLTGNVGGNVTGSVGSVASGGITSASFGAGAITATVIATDAIDADALAADAVTEIWAKTMTELTSVPAATGGTALQALTFLIEAANHKITQTSTTQTLYKADSSTVLATFTVADDGTTFSRTKLS